MSVAAELEKLNELRKTGVLTDAEYERQKKRVLDDQSGASPTTVPDWAQVPLRQKWWFQCLVTLLVVPVGVVLLLVQPAFRKKKGQVVRVGKGFKLLLVVLVAAIWIVNLPSFDKATSGTASLPTCDSRAAERLVRNAVENGVDARSRNWKLLDLTNARETSFDAVKPERLCRGTAVLNAGERPIVYRIWPASRGDLLLVEIRLE